jgi:hypothetical protein
VFIFSASNSGGRENRKNGFFCLVVGFLIFIQIAITPQAGGPHHYPMNFSVASLGVRLRSEVVVSRVATRNLQPLAGVVFGSAELSEKT